MPADKPVLDPVDPDLPPDGQREAWRRWRPAFHAWLGSATDIMLDMAAVRAGSRVLELAAGSGVQALRIAERVESRGHVLALEPCVPLVDFAAQAARDAGFTNIEARAMAGDALDLGEAGFDAAACRLGLTRFAELPLLLEEARRALRPGGRMAAMVFTAPDRNPLFAQPFTAAARHAPQADATLQRLFGLGVPVALEAALQAAGFTGIESRALNVPLRLPSVEEAVLLLQDCCGLLRRILSGVAPPAAQTVWEETAAALAAFAGRRGVTVPGEVLICVGTK